MKVQSDQISRCLSPLCRNLESQVNSILKHKKPVNQPSDGSLRYVLSTNNFYSVKPQTPYYYAPPPKVSPSKITKMIVIPGPDPVSPAWDANAQVEEMGSFAKSCEIKPRPSSVKSLRKQIATR